MIRAGSQSCNHPMYAIITIIMRQECGQKRFKNRKTDISLNEYEVTAKWAQSENKEAHYQALGNSIGHYGYNCPANGLTDGNLLRN